jgi:hypothetical protein
MVQRKKADFLRPLPPEPLGALPYFEYFWGQR